MQSQVGKLLDDEKEYQFTIQQLNDQIAQLKSKCIDTSKYETWSAPEIVAWITSFDDGRFVKYKDVLLANLSEEGIVGEDLCNVNEIDLKSWGIKQFKDKKYLMRKIRELTQQNNQNDHVNDNNNDNDNDKVHVIAQEEVAESGGWHR